MPRPSVSERARRYVATMESPRRAQSDPQDSHAVMFKAAAALVHGFALDYDPAYQLLEEFAQRSDLPWTPSELHHKIVSAQETHSPQGVGYLLGDQQVEGVSREGAKARSGGAPAQAPKADSMQRDVAFDLASLKELAGEWAAKADLCFLANRSLLDPCEVTAQGYLEAMYQPSVGSSPAVGGERGAGGAQGGGVVGVAQGGLARTAEGEKVLVFTRQWSQGECLWPDEADKLPRGGPDGVWYLAQPVDGKYYLNPRSTDKEGKPKMSRRSAESVTAFRYLLLESDDAPARDWLGALVQLPLRIAAIYTSGGRSVHALVRVDCRTKASWDAEKQALAPALGLLRRAGMDRGALSAVRLTRLPGAIRGGRMSVDGGRKTVVGGRLQKLLYVRPEAPLRPICELPPVRDVEADWLKRAEYGIADSDETGGKWLLDALRYYANVSAPLKARLQELEGEL